MQLIFYRLISILLIRVSWLFYLYFLRSWRCFRPSALHCWYIRCSPVASASVWYRSRS